MQRVLALTRGRKEPLLRSKVRCPLEAVRTSETQVRAERVTHRVDEPLGAAGTKPSSTHSPITSTRPPGSIKAPSFVV